MSYETRAFRWILVAAGVIMLGCLIVLPDPWRGRCAILVLAAAGLSLVPLRLWVNRAYLEAMRRAARLAGLEVVSCPAEEAAHPVLGELKRILDADVYGWKVAGRFPALVGVKEKAVVVVRVPPGVDFDAAAPDCTRVAALVRVSASPFAVYDRGLLRGRTPQGHQIAMPADDFSARYLVTGFKDEEVKGILGSGLRRTIVEAGGVGFRGIEVSRYGVFVHEAGKVVDPQLIASRVELVSGMAAQVPGEPLVS
ncbi:MAG: hypothetical protein AB1503_06985 [Bacillota bacterium]